MNAGRTFRAVALPALLILVWQIWGSAQPPDRGFPVPTGVVSAAWQMLLSGDLQTAIGVSTIRVLLGFAIGAAIAVVFGILMGYYRPVERNVDPLVQTFRMVAAIALVPLAVIWFGPHGTAAVFIVSYGAFFPVIINTISGVHGVEPTLVRASRTMGLQPRRVLQHVILPGSLPTIFVGLRLGMGTAWGAIIAAELTVSATATITNAGAGLAPTAAATGGIGFLMYYLYDNRVDLNAIVVCMITVGLAAFLIDRLLRFSQRRLIPWARHAS
jgi:ABC-type nitrate/sulfonate/bicarbonate transport system permease component